MKQYAQVVAVLKSAQDSIKRIMNTPQDQNHAVKIHHSLQREIDSLGLLTGTSDPNPEKKVVHGPAKTIAGERIPEKKVIKVADLQPEKTKVSELKDKVEMAWKEFPTTDNEQIIKSMDDLTIRGVAKKAGVKVSSNEPKILTVQFIEEIKKEMQVIADKEKQAIADKDKDPK